MTVDIEEILSLDLLNPLVFSLASHIEIHENEIGALILGHSLVWMYGNGQCAVGYSHDNAVHLGRVHIHVWERLKQAARGREPKSPEVIYLGDQLSPIQRIAAAATEDDFQSWLTMAGSEDSVSMSLSAELFGDAEPDEILKELRAMKFWIDPSSHRVYVTGDGKPPSHWR